MTKSNSQFLIAAAVTLTLLGTSAAIFFTKKVFEGAADQNANPYNSIPISRILAQAFGLGGDLSQCQANQDNMSKADDLMRQGRQLAEEKNYKGALELFDDSVEHYRRYPGLNCVQAVEVLEEKATCQKHLGLTDEYEKTLRSLVDVAGKAYNPSHMQVASALEDLGDYLCNQNRPADALPFLERAYEIRLAGDGEYGSETAYAMTQLGHCYLDLKNYKRADELYIKAIASYKKLDGDGFSEAQQIARENLANSYCWQDRYKEAMECEMSVLEDLEKKSLGQSYYAAKTLAAAGGTAQRQNDESRMHQFLQRAEKIAGGLNKPEDAPKQAELYGDIAEAYDDGEDYKHELAALQQSINSFRTEKFPQAEDKQNYAQNLVRAGSCALKLKQPEHACEYFGLALTQAKEDQEIRVKLKANKEEIEEYLRYIEKDKHAPKDPAIKMQASELKQMLVG